MRARTYRVERDLRLRRTHPASILPHFRALFLSLFRLSWFGTILSRIALDARVRLIGVRVSTTLADDDVDTDGLNKREPSVAQERKQRFAALFAEVMEAFASGVLRPLPTESFGAADTLEMFRVMAAGRHSGKLVVRVD